MFILSVFFVLLHTILIYSVHEIQHFSIQNKNLKIKIRMKGTIGRFTLAVMLISMIVVNALAESSTRTSVDLPAVAGYTLEPGKMYIVRTSMEITALHGNGLNVAPKGSGQAPILYIPAGVKLTVTGADASGRTGAGAGIYVPSNAELIITGAGILEATGGNAGSGENGQNGQNGGNYIGSDAADWKDWGSLLGSHDENMVWSGAGGRGGNGGGGAAAGIGGIGGQGGQGGNGAAAVGGGDTTVDGDGGDKYNGGNGAAGGSMGKVYIMGTVNVTATAGNNTGKTAGTVGSQGYSLVHTTGIMKYIAGAGGGGGGGGVGCVPTYGIGAGAPGAGGGAGGGSGAFDQIVRTTTLQKVDNNSGRASSGNGGKGSINGGSPTSERPRDAGKSGTVVVSVCPQVGGIGGNGGAQGAAGNNGSIYIAPTAIVTGTHEASSGSAPTDMQITITFRNNEYAATTNNGSTQVAKNSNVSSSITVNIGDPLPNATITAYKLTAVGDPEGTSGEKYESSHKYFAGYYTAEGGLGTRIYKGISTDGTNLANGNGINAVPFAKDVTLYSHFTHVHHVINWDYTYSNGVNIDGKSTWVNLNHSEYLQHGKLIFYGPMKSDGTRDVIKSIIMEAYSTNKDGATADATDQNFIFKYQPSAGAENHTRAVGNIFLHAGSGSDQLNTKSNIDVYFDDDQLVQFSEYAFIPWDNDKKPDNWETIVDRNNHQTVFSFTGAKGDNQFELKWKVTLTGLKVYPDHIFVKPMYLNSESKWALISQLPERYDGVSCAMVSHVDDQDPSKTNAVYTGQYPVWKHNASDVEYDNKIGLVGFTLDGKTYYMDATPGAVTTVGMQSTDHLKFSTNDTEDHRNHIINMTVDASTIPVLRLMPNGGTLSAKTPTIIVNEDRSGVYDLSKYSATRSGYALTAWTTNEDGTGTSYAPNDQVNTTSALTLYAKWTENVPPVISTKEIQYKQEGATVVVSVSDNVSTPQTGLKVYAYVSDTQVTGNVEDITGWTEVTVKQDTEGEYEINLYDIDITNKSWAWVYVKAVDAAENVAYQSSPDRIKTDGIAPTYDIYPLGNVCNFDVQITVKDNIQIAKVEYKRSFDADWKTVSEFVQDPTPTEKLKKFIVPKLTESEKSNEVCNETTHTPVELSLRITDGADNVTVYENHTHMFYDHLWDTANPHHAVVLDEFGNYKNVKYYNCKHDCGHIWAVDIIGGEPGTLYNRDSSTEHYQQGLMRSETTNFVSESGATLISNNKGEHVAVANGINNAITAIESLEEEKKSDNKEYTLILVDNTNIEVNNEGTPTSTSSITSPTNGNKVTIDLNASSLLVNGSAGTITGNENVTILLNDNGTLNYANRSTVNSTPIAYKRNFAASTRAGKWQALYLPFDVSSVSDYELGTVKSVSITNETAELKVLKGTTEITANSPYFIRSTEGTVNINVTSGTLQPYTDPTESPISGNYTIKGSLIDNDNQATKDKAYWVLTNGGAFTWAKDGSHQRPYHWVIYDKRGGSTPSAKALSMIIVEEEATGINAVNKEMKSSNAVYTLDGRKINNTENLAPGMYIIGSKKIVIK